MLEPGRLNAFTEADLNSLIIEAVPENRQIDYKRDTYGNREADKAEVTKDLSAFANTIGGFLIIGMEEADGVPTGIPGFLGNIDQEILRLEQIATHGIKPRLLGLRFKEVPLVNGGAAIVVWVPRSMSPPHAAKDDRYYYRTSRNVERLDVHQLKSLVLEGESRTARVRDWRLGRIMDIKTGNTPIPMMRLDDDHFGSFALHVAPLSAFSAAPPEANFGGLNTLVPVGGGPGNLFRRRNLDGLVRWTGEASAAAAYLQLFRDGCLETVRTPAGNIVQDARILRNAMHDNIGRDAIRYVNAMHASGLPLPYVLMVSLIGVAGARQERMVGDDVELDDPAFGFNSDVVSPVEQIVENNPNEAVEAFRRAMRDVAWAIGLADWNAPIHDHVNY